MDSDIREDIQELRKDLRHIKEQQRRGLERIEERQRENLILIQRTNQLLCGNGDIGLAARHDRLEQAFDDFRYDDFASFKEEVAVQAAQTSVRLSGLMSIGTNLLIVIIRQFLGI